MARNYGFLIYGTLFGVDKNLAPKPQMAEGCTLPDDKLAWTFRLREGLRFHDGPPARASRGGQGQRPSHRAMHQGML